jgi:purine-binding chemotaxis protein CheW
MSAAAAFAKTNLPQDVSECAADSRCFTVIVEKRSFGLPVEAIQTVFEMVSVTPVPLAPDHVLGLVNLRGKIATAISLRRRLGTDPIATERSNLAVGLEHRGESFALVVDDVGDVLTLDKTTEIDVPPHLGGEGVKFSSVHRLEHEILPVLDLDWALALGAFEKV